MPLTTRQLYDATALTPADLGADVVSPELSEEDALQKALDYIEENVLPISYSEVSVPVREAIGNYTAQLDNYGITQLFGDFSGDVIALWDAAQTSYGRSELNKRVDSNSKSYDEDSDQDRIQGNQRLAKLIALVARWKAAQDDLANPPVVLADPVSRSVPVKVVW